jgi:hypothetical protein
MQSKSQTHKPYGTLKQLLILEQPWNSISMDFIKKLPLSVRFDTILVIVDCFTKQSLFISMYDTIASAMLVKLFILHIFSKHGVPSHITCYTLNPIEVWSWSWSQGCIELDLASAYVLHPYVTICLSISEYRSLGRRRTRTRDSGKIRYLNWGISPQLVGLKYKMWSTKRGTYSEGDQA